MTGGRAAERWAVAVAVPDTDGLYVDVVPARKAGEVWEIPLKDGGWQETNPLKVTNLKEDMNDTHDGLYVPAVKLLRQSRRTLLGDSKPGGFAIEMALYTACDESLVFGDSMAEFFASGLEGVAEVFRRVSDEGFEIPDPSMEGQTLTFNVTDTEWTDAKDKFAQAAIDAREALDLPETKAGKAALLIQAILGGNDDFTNVFPMPYGFNSDGTKRAVVHDREPGESRLPAGSPRFA